MPFIAEDINENAVYILRKSESGSFYTEYIKIEKDLLSEIALEPFYIKLNVNTYPQLDTRARVEKMQQAIIHFYNALFENYPNLFIARNYSEDLSSQYGRFFSITSIKQFSLFDINTLNHKPFLIKLPQIDQLNRWYNAENFKGYTNKFFHSYFLQMTYLKCHNTPDILIYSHRKAGWIEYSYVLNETLSVKIQTNFAYGSASYLVITLIFEGVLVVPYSRLVYYRNVDAIQILKNTREYIIENESWKVALDFIRDASNDFQKDGNDGFIKKYVVRECEYLVEALERCLTLNKIRQSDNLSGFNSVKPETIIEIKLEGFELIVVRGEKIAGATEFIESISKWEGILPTKEFINRINTCCLKVLPQLSKGIDEIEKLLKLKQLQYEILCKKRDEIKVIVDDLLPKTNFYQSELRSVRDEIRNSYVETNRIHTIDNKDLSTLVLKEISQRHPELKDIEKRFYTIREELDKIRNECTVLNETLSTHQDYLSSIIRNKHLIEKHLKIEG